MNKEWTRGHLSKLTKHESRLDLRNIFFKCLKLVSRGGCMCINKAWSDFQMKYNQDTE